MNIADGISIINKALTCLRTHVFAINLFNYNTYI